MRLLKLGVCRPIRTRSYNRMAVLSMAMFLSSFSVVYFIYTSPGRANAYLYQIQIFQNSIYSAMQRGGYVDVLRGFTNGSELNQGILRTSSEEFVEPKDLVYLPKNFSYSKTDVCPERFPEMNGEIEVNLTEIPIESMNEKFKTQVHFGGTWQPDDCIPKYKVAVMVPFRNRPTHLPILLRHIYPMMMSQRLNFTIFLIEQRGEYPFNRAMLFNAGFLEINKHFGTDYDCLLFHDVDHIPENNRNYYGCSNMPRHFAKGLDIHAYKLEYEDFFGGVSGVTCDQFRSVNGYSNQFWGWGGEDDDFYNRITNRKEGGYNISRPAYSWGKYTSIKKHHVQEAMFLGRFSLLKSSIERMYVDGLNSIKLNTPAIITRNPLYTNISIDLVPVKNLDKITSKEVQRMS